MKRYFPIRAARIRMFRVQQEVKGAPDAQCKLAVQLPQKFIENRTTYECVLEINPILIRHQSLPHFRLNKS